MKNILENTKDFKIIPNNFKSSGEFEIISIEDNCFKVKLSLFAPEEIKDYEKGSNVEIFGANNAGLVYFETTILDKNDDILTLSMTEDYSIIQRREYSRVQLNQGKIIFKDMGEDIVEKIEDISAGGVKFISRQDLSIDKQYETDIVLSNNMRIECAINPIRTVKENGRYIISAKFTNLENVDRIVLVQYAFKIKMEEQKQD